MRRYGAASIALVLGLATGVTPSFTAPTAGVSPVVDRANTGVTADALPTVQIDGVVWSQAIVGNTVYAGGSFTNARPAGAAPGTQLTPRSNLLAYNLSTGTLITSFDPVINGPIKSVEASPDGSRLYIGGSFTTVNGANRYRLAAFDIATGQLNTSFKPGLDATVNSLSVTNTTVYAGGIFSMAAGTARIRLAAFSAATGALLGWNPTADDTVNAVLLTPDTTHLIVGGAFANVNGSPALGLTSLDSTTAVMVPFAANQVVKNYSSRSAILSLSTDGKAIYGTGYQSGFGSLEGTFSANPSTGSINWIEDCHGDTYGAYANGGQVYVVSHEHYCANIGGFPDANPRTAYYRSTAFTTNATGTILPNGETSGAYVSFAGYPSPSLINWFPSLTAGTFTKQIQAAWSVTGNGKYVVEGGEFPSVNGTPQQGLVRFAIPTLASKKRGPMDTAADTTPTATAASATSAKITWPANWDQDNDHLTYRLMRSGSTAPVYTTTAVSQFWNRPTLTYTDAGLAPRTTYKYTVYTSDPDGNTVSSPSATVTTPGGTSPPPPVRATTATTVTASPSAPVAGQAVSVSVLVQSANGTPAVGSVAISVDSGAAQTVALQSGHAQLNTSFASPGQHVVAASYAGTTSFAPSSTSKTITVGMDSSAVSAVVSPTRPISGQPFSVSSTVRTVAPGTLAATGTVTVSVDGTATATTVVTSAGTATTRLSGLRFGSHTITVLYSGDGAHTAATTSISVFVPE